MRHLPALALFALALTPLAPAQKTVPGPDATIQRNDQLHARAVDAVNSEQARAKQQPCPDAENTLAINTCMAKELGITNANYLKLVRALGGLLRMDADSPKARIPFDDAEDTWKKYRDQACKVAEAQYAGGTMATSVGYGCQITITQHHIAELGQVYSNLGTQ